VTRIEGVDSETDSDSDGLRPRCRMERVARAPRGPVGDSSE
jgi:hypothetical protein